ncbi:integration host factor subunit alpha [Novosphingobium sp. AP12]|uniref:integration host factor subunit alpha n=1 Tax=Novosphingobium sp. AP12 TaxID=1144305 RepID=UPI0002721981|nr:integration host factor subunit alpha [Novosphingobium sp. AP12]EJL33740.1 bacterial nucleoid DNA-binding protein [Novosphingobium sp. AP12]
MQTLTRAGLTVALQEKAGLSKRKADAVVNGIIECMCEALERGEQVKLSGFGTFILRDKNERMGRNPKSGNLHLVTARRVIGFRASPLVKRRLVAPQM